VIARRSIFCVCITTIEPSTQQGNQHRGQPQIAIQIPDERCVQILPRESERYAAAKAGTLTM
jgi:hypothetical protein